AFSVFLLAGATVLAITATEETGVDLIGALVFPMGLVIVVLLNVELLTGNFALVPLAVVDRRASVATILRDLWRVLLGHLRGGVTAAALFAARLTRWSTTDTADAAQGIIDTTATKTLEYQDLGYIAGACLALLSGTLCNW